jgi:hypothetical protein
MKTASFLALLVVGLLSFIPQTSSGAGQFRAVAQQDQQKDRDDKDKKDKGKTESKASGVLGSNSNPIRCSGPRGEREYLNRLRCSDGKAPKFYRIGSFGKGPYGHILDGYSVKCADADEVTIFMDMYHDHVETEAVPGFRIVNEEQKSVARRTR